MRSRGSGKHGLGETVPDFRLGAAARYALQPSRFRYASPLTANSDL